MRCHRCGRDGQTCVDVSDVEADDGCAVCITERRELATLRAERDTARTAGHHAARKRDEGRKPGPRVRIDPSAPVYTEADWTTLVAERDAALVELARMTLCAEMGDAALARAEKAEREAERQRSMARADRVRHVEDHNRWVARLDAARALVERLQAVVQHVDDLAVDGDCPLCTLAYDDEGCPVHEALCGMSSLKLGDLNAGALGEAAPPEVPAARKHGRCGVESPCGGCPDCRPEEAADDRGET